jgi:hypothetical protein
MDNPLRPLGFVGVAMALCALVVTVLSPQAMGPLPHGLVTPVLAFELAKDVHEVETMFGAPASTERAAWVAAMRAGTLADFGLLTLYGILLAGIARRLARAMGAAGHTLDISSTAVRRAHVAVSVAVAAALLDVLENRELLLILESLAHDTRDYDGALLRLGWVVWPKWLALGAWFVLLSPELVRAGGALRLAAMAGSLGALTGVLAAMRAGNIAEVMALSIAIGMVALVPGCLRKLPGAAETRS